MTLEGIISSVPNTISATNNVIYDVTDGSASGLAQGTSVTFEPDGAGTGAAAKNVIAKT